LGQMECLQISVSVRPACYVLSPSGRPVLSWPRFRVWSARLFHLGHRFCVWSGPAQSQCLVPFCPGPQCPLSSRPAIFWAHSRPVWTDWGSQYFKLGGGVLHSNCSGRDLAYIIITHLLSSIYAQSSCLPLAACHPGSLQIHVAHPVCPIRLTVQPVFWSGPRFTVGLVILPGSMYGGAPSGIQPYWKWVSLGHHRPDSTAWHMVKENRVPFSLTRGMGVVHTIGNILRGLYLKENHLTSFLYLHSHPFGLFSENPSSEKYCCHPGVHGFKTC